MIIKQKKHTELGMRIARAIVGVAGKKRNEFAVLLGVPPSNLSRWINGTVAPSYEYIIKIANISGVSFEWLLTGKGEIRRGIYNKEEEKPSTIAEKPAIYNNVKGDPELKEIVDILKHDIPEVKGAFLKLLKTRKALKEGVKDLMQIDKPLKEEG